MAKLPEIKRLSKGDFPEAPEWINKLLGPLNSFFESVFLALNRNLSYAENFASQIKELTFTTASDYEVNDTWTEIKFPITMNTRPQGAQVIDVREKDALNTPLSTPFGIQWRLEGGNFVVTFISGLEDSTKYVIKVLVI